MRSIKQVIRATKVNMGGIILDQPLPNQHIDSLDPFLLIHHWKSELAGGQHPRDAGVGPHPHRGFSPVTFVYQGGVHHRDSRGNDHIVYAGGTQWMDTGKGIVHSERPPQHLAEDGGNFEIIQFWINTPAKYKMDQPRYQPLSAGDTPILRMDNGNVKAGIVAGTYEGIQGPIQIYFPMTIMRITAEADAHFTLNVPAHFNLLVYQLDGLTIANQDQYIYDKTLIWYDNDDETMEFQTKQGAEMMLLSGQPIGEKVNQYGPFVMNNQTEILEAIRDAQMGKMGVLIEEF